MSSPKKYIDKMVNDYERMFNEQPKTTYHSPSNKGDHPEMDKQTVDILVYEVPLNPSFAGY
jgi:hypothetical protein